MIHHLHIAWITRSLFVIAMLSGAGCQSLPSPTLPKMPWEKDEPKMPDRILAIWSDTVLHQPGQPGLRGFGGRIFFYSEEKPDPIKVDGGIMVYAFDADHVDPADPKPLKRFAFTPDQFAEMHSKASLGHSYSVWIPWDEVGGTAISLSLVVKFEGREGGTVISEPVVKLLPGVPKQTQDPASSEIMPRIGARDDQSGVRQASYIPEDGSRSTASSDDSRRRVETIALPPSFSRHLEARRSMAGSQSTSLAERQEMAEAGARGAERTGAERRGESSSDSMDESVQRLDIPRSETTRTDSSSAETTSSNPVVGGERLPVDPTRQGPFSDRPRAGSEAGSRFRRFPARNSEGSPASEPALRTQPFPGGWLDGLPATPRPSVRSDR